MREKNKQHESMTTGFIENLNSILINKEKYLTAAVLSSLVQM